MWCRCLLTLPPSGNVGKEVLKQIRQSGVQLRAAFQSVTKGASAPSGVEIVIVDFNQSDTLRAALKHVDRVFLVGPPTAQLRVLERKAIDAIRQSDVPQVVKLSAMGGREAIFPRQHAESEDYIQSAGVPFTFLRPNGFMQNMVNYNAPTINTENAFYGTESDSRVSQIDLRDVAAVAVKALTEDGHVGRAYTKYRDSHPILLVGRCRRALLRRRQSRPRTSAQEQWQHIAEVDNSAISAS